MKKNTSLISFTFTDELLFRLEVEENTKKGRPHTFFTNIQFQVHKEEETRTSYTS